MQKKSPFLSLVSKMLLLTILLLTGLTYFPSSGRAASSFESVKDVISNSDIGTANVTHTITASTSLAVDANGYIEIVFPGDFSGISSANLTCPNGGSTGGSGNTVRCTYTSGIEATSSIISLTGVTNPAAIGSYIVYIYNKQQSTAIKEQSTFRIAIVNHVDVSASVEASLTFTVLGVATSSDINGVVTTGSSTQNSLAFGVLAPGAVKTLAQQLNVTTNATYGYTVTVAQNHNLVSSGGADIDSFVDGIGATTTAVSWVAPAGTLGQENTYGHLGFTSTDGSLSNGDAYGAALFKGFKNSNPVEVLYHNGPSDGATEGVGSTSIAYSIEIGPLQESGDYSSQLNYVCTPTY